ncbi:MAG TPA: hypothetical protein VKA28_04415 [Candidatus Bathyarchaeia archaeon]|nr:hypothetical protein [Candidatus Bathyarchaeia archaeon]
MRFLLATVLLLVIIGGPVLARTVNTNRDSTTSPSESHLSHITKQRALHGLVPFDTILRTEFGHAQIGVTEINDPETWSAFWDQNCNLAVGIRPLGNCPPLPQINFTTQTILVASPGLEGSPGYQFNITKVIAVHNHLLVEATLTTPGLLCIWIQVVTFPIHVIEVPKTNLAPTLNMTQTQAPECPY